MSINHIIRLSATPENFGEVEDEIDESMFVSTAPVQHTHSYYENEEIGLYIGVWDTTDMTETGGPYSCDEFMWLLEGEVDIQNNESGQREKVAAGEAFVIPKGYNCQWQQQGYLRKFYVISAHPNESVPSAPSIKGICKPILKLESEGDVSIHSQVVSTNAVTQSEQLCYQDTLGRFTSGTWEVSAFESSLMLYPHHEFMVIQNGSVTLFDEQGHEQLFKAGDALFIPQGTPCRWQVSGNLRAFFAAIKSA